MAEKSTLEEVLKELNPAEQEAALLIGTAISPTDRQIQTTRHTILFISYVPLFFSFCPFDKKSIPKKKRNFNAKYMATHPYSF